MEREYDVIVVGAGIAGICAWDLLQRGGREVLLIEAGPALPDLRRRSRKPRPGVGLLVVSAVLGLVPRAWSGWWRQRVGRLGQSVFSARSRWRGLAMEFHRLG